LGEQKENPFKMSEYKLMTNVGKWCTNDVAEHLNLKGLGKYSSILIENGIDGEVADTIGEDNLREMGVSKIGDRLKILKALDEIKQAKAQDEFCKTLWEGKEILYPTCYDRIFSTCFGICPEEHSPSTYELTPNYLTIKVMKPCRFLCFKCCCFESSYEINNVDLSQVIDVNIKGVNPSWCERLCCFGKTIEEVRVETRSGEVNVMRLGAEDGQAVANKIKRQVEMAQRIERNPSMG